MGAISNFIFGDNSNKTSYKQAAYDKYYQQAIGNTLDKVYDDDAIGKLQKMNIMNGLTQNAKDSLSSYNATKNDYFGNGLIGSLLNPIAQTVNGVMDLGALAASGGKRNAWDKSQDPLGVSRDVGSDIGAAAETALTLIPMAKGASLAKAGKAVKAGTATAKQAAKYAASQIPKSTARKMASAGLLGAGYGASGSLRDMGFENFDPSKFALSTAIGAGMGAGITGLGSAIGGLSTSTKPVVTQNTAPYQEALNNLKSYAPNNYSNTPTNLPSVGGTDFARVTLDNLDDDTLKQMFRSGIQKAKGSGSNITNTATTSIKNSKDLLSEYLKNGAPKTTTYETVKAKNAREAIQNIYNNTKNSRYGRKVSSLLKTKKGKIGAGVGAGLVLNKVLNGKKNQELSDDELDELYNYYYGGQ